MAILLRSHFGGFRSLYTPRTTARHGFPDKILTHDLLRIRIHLRCRDGLLGASLRNGRPGKSNTTYLLVLRIAFGREVGGTSIIVTGLFQDGMESRCLCPLAVQTITCRKQKGGMERSRRMSYCAHVHFRTPSSQRQAIQNSREQKRRPWKRNTVRPTPSSAEMSGLTLHTDSATPFG